MARIMAIDYGAKRTGIAVTDPLQIISTPLCTQKTSELFSFLHDYMKEEDVTCIVIGYPTDTYQRETHATKGAIDLAEKLKREFPEVSIEMMDERYSSLQAKKIILQSGITKKKRRDKTLIDKVSASVILERYMQKNKNWLT